MLRFAPQIVGALQVHYLPQDAYYGAASNSQSGLMYYLYPYPGGELISPNDTGSMLCASKLRSQLHHWTGLLPQGTSLQGPTLLDSGVANW